MNCQQGDLAKIAIPESQIKLPVERAAQGHICVCKRLADPLRAPMLSGEPAWEVSPPIHFEGVVYGLVLDRVLKPFRPGDEPDETFEWAGKPEKLEENA